jgi:Uncharacterized protein conserved in bacteria (DUF2188)
MTSSTTGNTPGTTLRIKPADAKWQVFESDSNDIAVAQFDTQEAALSYATALAETRPHQATIEVYAEDGALQTRRQQ